MKHFRMLFGLPFACLALLIAFSAPSTRLDYGPGIYATSYAVPDLIPATADVDHVAILAEAVPVDKPADGHLVAYTVANQPLTAWRFTADSYQHIDPHRRTV